MGASSFSPSPITTMPSMRTLSSIMRMASTAAWSAASLSPIPVSRAAARAAYSVTRTRSSARLRSGRRPVGSGVKPSEGSGRLSLDLGLLLAHDRAHEHEDRPQQHPVPADLQLDRPAGIAGPVDDTGVEDDAEGGDRHDGGHLAAGPGELV